jgi:hypothetical protein
LIGFHSTFYFVHIFTQRVEREALCVERDRFALALIVVKASVIFFARASEAARCVVID